MIKEIIKPDKEKIKYGVYKATFKTELDLDNGAYIQLTIKITRDMQYLLKLLCIDESIDDKIFNNNFERYKYKNKLIKDIADTYKSLLFNKELVDDGETELMMDSIPNCEQCVQYYKEAFKSIIRTMLLGTRETEVEFDTKKLK